MEWSRVRNGETLILGDIVQLADNPKRKYHEVIEIPLETDIETAKSNYNNGILEIVFKKKAEAKPKGKEIKVE
jgi:HSP20 family protein